MFGFSEPQSQLGRWLRQSTFFVVGRLLYWPAKLVDSTTLLRGSTATPFDDGRVCKVLVTTPQVPPSREAVSPPRELWGADV